MTVQATLKGFGAPIEMQDWAAERSFLEVWQECPRGDWLISVLAASPLDGKVLTLAALDCAEPCLRYVRGSTYALLNAAACAKNWAKGLAGVQVVKLAVQQAGDEENEEAPKIVQNFTPEQGRLSGMARYAIRSAAHSAIGRLDAQNAVYAASECGAEDTTLAVSAARIRARVGYDAARTALGL